MKKISGIEERLSSGPHGFPNAIVITLICQDSPYITVAPLESRTRDSSGIVLLTIALHRYREHIAACAADEAGYLLAPEQELLGYMIDGHHRTEGAYAAGKLDSPFLTGVYLDLDLRKMAASFAEINCNQEKPSAIHTNAIRNLSGLMSDRENTAFDLMDELNGRAYVNSSKNAEAAGALARNQPTERLQLHHFFRPGGGHRDLFFRLEGMLPAGLGQFRARSDQNNGNRHPV